MTQEGSLTPWNLPDFACEIEAPLPEQDTMMMESESEGEEEVGSDPILLQDTLETLEGMIHRLKETLALTEEALYQTITSVIGQSVLKLCLREIALDETVLFNMVQEARLKMKLVDVPIEVHLCPQDYQRLEALSMPDAKWVLDEQLSMGDFKIKTTLQEVEAILQERVVQLLECKV